MEQVLNVRQTELKWDKDGFIPAIVQDASTGKVLMLGYMNEATWLQTLETSVVTFYSRSRQEVWVKGATSGNYLYLEDWSADCDKDALLLKVNAKGPACHTGAVSCFGTSGSDPYAVLKQLQAVIDQRFTEPKEGSYIRSLIDSGIAKIAQKVGEEGVEVVIEAMREEPMRFLEESADLLFHYLVLLRAKNVRLEAVLSVLEGRNK